SRWGAGLVYDCADLSPLPPYSVLRDSWRAVRYCRRADGRAGFAGLVQLGLYLARGVSRVGRRAGNYRLRAVGGGTHTGFDQPSRKAKGRTALLADPQAPFGA